jgi:bifunctional DNA-binding transcriptional regulator/antitoxin component of YhaV-PrlF toxin-antitoxin module
MFFSKSHLRIAGQIMQNCITIEKGTAMEAVMAALKVTARGQVTLRKDVLRHLGVRPGERLEIDLLPGGEIRGRALKKKGRISDLAGFLKGKTNGAKLTIEEMDQAIGDAVVAEFLRGAKR